MFIYNSIHPSSNEINNSQTGGKNEKLETKTGNTSMIGIVIGILAILLCICIGIFLFFRHRKNKIKALFSSNEMKLNKIKSFSMAEGIDSGNYGLADGIESKPMNYGLAVEMHNRQTNAMISTNMINTRDEFENERSNDVIK